MGEWGVSKRNVLGMHTDMATTTTLAGCLFCCEDDEVDLASMRVCERCSIGNLPVASMTLDEVLRDMASEMFLQCDEILPEPPRVLRQFGSNQVSGRHHLRNIHPGDADWPSHPLANLCNMCPPLHAEVYSDYTVRYIWRVPASVDTFCRDGEGGIVFVQETTEAWPRVAQ